MEATVIGRRIPKWTREQVAAAAMPIAQAYIQNPRISIGPQAVRVTRLSPTVLGVEFDTGPGEENQLFAFIVEELDISDG